MIGGNEWQTACFGGGRPGQRGVSVMAGDVRRTERPQLFIVMKCVGLLAFCSVNACGSLLQAVGACTQRQEAPTQAAGRRRQA